VGGDPGATEVVYKGVLRRWLFGWREVRVRGLASTRLQLWEVLLGREFDEYLVGDTISVEWGPYQRKLEESVG
jgi:hypothetical protein